MKKEGSMSTKTTTLKKRKLRSFMNPESNFVEEKPK
jgi:hypothetical protein